MRAFFVRLGADLVAAWNAISAGCAWFFATMFGRVVAVCLAIIIGGSLLYNISGAVFHWWSPDVSEAHNEWRNYQKRDLAVGFKKSSAKTEAFIGTKGIITDDCGAYDAFQRAVLVEENGKKGDLVIPKGTKVLVVRENMRDSDQSSEGRYLVVLPNKNGDFIKSQEKDSNAVYVPGDKVKFTSS